MESVMDGGHAPLHGSWWMSSLQIRSMEGSRTMHVLMHHLRALWAFVRISVMEDVQYRARFVAHCIQTLFWFVGFLIVLQVYFLHTDNLGGWRYSEALIVFGVFQFMLSIILTVFQPNIGRLVEYVRQGTLDFIITKPLHTQFTVSVRHLMVWHSVGGIAGIGIAIYGAVLSGHPLTAWHALLFGLLLTSGAVIVYSVMLLFMSLSFWFVRVENIGVLLSTFWEAGRYPITVYRGIPRALLTYVLPVAFVTTV
ncbi:MAG TPA: hypothetical protein EYP10_09005, partial [Armatimonadetes bacterium]|nr:hypothetical protein [Armatimonadota bacterium]